MIVKYKGHKAEMPVHRPIGAKKKTQVKDIVLITKEGVDLPEEQALKLVALDPFNFELEDAGAGDPKKKAEIQAQIRKEAEAHAEAKRTTRKRKSKASEE